MGWEVRVIFELLFSSGALAGYRGEAEMRLDITMCWPLKLRQLNH